MEWKLQLVKKIFTKIENKLKIIKKTKIPIPVPVKNNIQQDLPVQQNLIEAVEQKHINIYQEESLSDIENVDEVLIPEMGKTGSSSRFSVFKLIIDKRKKASQNIRDKEQ